MKTVDSAWIQMSALVDSPVGVATHNTYLFALRDGRWGWGNVYFDTQFLPAIQLGVVVSMVTAELMA